MKSGMIKVSVLYPKTETSKFDMDYYLGTHIPMVSELLGDALKDATVEEGIGSAAPGAPAPFACMGNMYFDVIEDFQNSFGPNAEKIMGDIPNFTDVQPTVQISVVKA